MCRVAQCGEALGWWHLSPPPLPALDAAQMMRPALPCSFGLAVIPTLQYEDGGFGGQIDGPGVLAARIIVPADEDLAEWVKSSLYLDELDHPIPLMAFGGWTPGRSVAVDIASFAGGTVTHETHYYRCMDHGYSDVRVFAELVPGCMARWTHVWKKFLLSAWNMLSRRCISTSRVRIMIANEVDAWDERWVRMVAEFLDDSWGGQVASSQREHIRDWSFCLIMKYESDLVRACVDVTFLQDPLRVLSLIG